MHKTQHAEEGFGSLELLLIAVIALIAIFAGWYAWYRHVVTNYISTSPSSGNVSTTQTPTSSATTSMVYHRSTNVPADWIIYRNDTYKISFYHPKNWTVTPDSHGNPELFDYEIGMGPYQQTYIALIGISQKTLTATTATFKKSYSVLADNKLSIDGDDAEMVRYKNGNTTERQYFVYANGYTYTLPTVEEDDTMVAAGGLSAKDSLTLFESVKLE